MALNDYWGFFDSPALNQLISEDDEKGTREPTAQSTSHSSAPAQATGPSADAPKNTASQEQTEEVEEIEYMFFLKLEDFEQLENAKRSERQEQWGMNFKRQGVENNLRIRRITEDGEAPDQFVLTTKINFPDIDGQWEIERDVERQHFDIVKDNADTGMIKKRYFFPIDGTDMVWEVDVFYDDWGRPCEWVKVDLEVPQRLKDLPEFPLEHTDAITNGPQEYTPAERRLVKKLFRDHFIQKPGVPVS